MNIFFEKTITQPYHTIILALDNLPANHISFMAALLSLPDGGIESLPVVFYIKKNQFRWREE
ncbi:MAG: hypothetical protein Kow0037_21080 [Calditrichia bacterium]